MKNKFCKICPYKKEAEGTNWCKRYIRYNLLGPCKYFEYISEDKGEKYPTKVLSYAYDDVVYICGKFEKHIENNFLMLGFKSKPNLLFKKSGYRAIYDMLYLCNPNEQIYRNKQIDKMWKVYFSTFLDIYDEGHSMGMSDAKDEFPGIGYSRLKEYNRYFLHKDGSGYFQEEVDLYIAKLKKESEK